MQSKIVNRIITIKISGKERKEKVLSFLYDNAQFRNLLLIFNNIYHKNFNNYLLNESYLYALISDRNYKPRGEKVENKLKEFNEILNRIMVNEDLKHFWNELKSQKHKVKNNVAIQTQIRQTIKDYKSYFNARKEYNKNPDKFNGEPKPPKPKKLENLSSYSVEFNKSSFQIIDNNSVLITLRFNNKQNEYLKVKLPNYIKPETITSLRLKFIGNDVYLDVVYKKEIKIEEKDKIHLAGIDLGLDNLLTIFSTNELLRSLIISGKEIKSFNQWYNKEKSKLQSEIDTLTNEIEKLKDDSNILEEYKIKLLNLKHKLKSLCAYRERWITDKLHKISRFVADYLYETGHKIVYIGNGVTTSKQNINIGKKNNQNFSYIPYRKLINLLKYKLEEYGIEVKEVNEEFTSKTSPFANIKEIIKLGKEYFEAKKNNLIEKVDELKSKLNELYNGKRIKRGLFKDFITNKIFNADVVGSYNILRKEAQPLLDVKILIDKLSRPIRLKLKEVMLSFRNLLDQVSRESLLKEGIAGSSPWVPCNVGGMR